MGKLTKAQIVGDLLVAEEITIEEAITLLEDSCKYRPLTREDFTWTMDTTETNGCAVDPDKEII
jgi:Lhr-like helicase